MSVVSKASGPHTEVTITGTLSRVDADGARPLTYDEFVDFVSGTAMLNLTSQHLDGISLPAFA